tara:strand:+ start:27834 stop:29618 length:1785 start_codon:yes stop_codon:yes gene_type:complete
MPAQNEHTSVSKGPVVKKSTAKVQLAKKNQKKSVTSVLDNSQKEAVFNEALKTMNICLTDNILRLNLPKDYEELIGVYVTDDSEDSRILIALDVQGLKVKPGSNAKLSNLLVTLRNWKYARPKKNAPNIITLSTNNLGIKKIREKFDIYERERKQNEDSGEWQSKINNIIMQAYFEQASDIHILYRQEDSKIKFRVHGDMKTYYELPSDDVKSLIGVLWATLCSEQGAEFEPSRTGHKAPAKINTIRQGVTYQHKLRIQTIPHNGGYYDLIARRLPGKDEAGKLDIEKAGYHPKQLKLFNRALRNKSGSIIFAGETGSGKSTSAYSCLMWYIRLFTNKNGELTKKIYDLGDPIEIEVPQITQIPVFTTDKVESKEDNYAKAIADILRSDPDFVQLSEMRTEKTAQSVVRLVQTGHPVLTTVHANSAFETVERCVNLGIPLTTLTGSNFLNLICHQTLAKEVCPNCAIPFEDRDLYKNELAAAQHSGFDTLCSDLTNLEMDLSNVVFTNHSGCDQCKNTGIIGRKMLAEVVLPDDEIRQALSRSIYDAEKIWYSRDESMSLMDHALHYIEKGVIDPFFIYNVVGDLVPRKWVSGL